MTSSSVLSSSILSTREYLVRTKTSHNHTNDFQRNIILRIFDDQQHVSEDIILNKSKSEYQSNDNKNIDRYHIQTEQKLSNIIRRLKLHAINTQNQQSENDKNKRIFLKWIELTDLNTKHTFCFSVNDYLPSSPGDALELTEVHENKICEENNQQEINIKNEKSNLIEDKSKYAKLYDIRTETGRQGFLGIKSLIKANVYLKLYDINHQSSESIPLTISNLHQQPFRSNQTDQFQIGTMNKLGRLEKVELWHDGNKGTRLHCDTLEITDLNNGQIYCFQIKGYLDGDQKFLLTDYDNRRCLKIHSEHKKSSKNDPIIYQTSEDEPSITSIPIQTTQKKASTTITNSISNSTNTDINQTLFKIRTKVGHKGFLSLGMGGTDANVYLRMHEGNKIANDILLNNSLTHNNPFEAGHIDVFEIGIPENIISPDQIEIFHNGNKHDGLYLKWIEIMNMKTLERKCFPVNRWLDSNENDKKTHLILTNFTLDESCEENEYHDHHTHDQYKTEYIIRTKTSENQPINQNDTYANIYLKIYNNKNNYTEDMLLNNSKNHRKPFQIGKIDQFDIGTIQLMDDNIDKIELWHDNKSDFNWLCEWIEIKNKKTGNIKCFSVNRLLSRKFSDGITKIPLTIQSNHPCDQIEHELNDLVKNTPIHTNKMQYLLQKHHHSLDKHDFKKKYIIKTRTGNKILSGTNANVFIRLYDDQNQESEDILLEQTVTNKIPFEKHTIDEFHIGTLKNLFDLTKIHLWHTGGKNQGWNVEWIQIEDLQTNRLYCFPVNKWLDSNSGERTTYVELTEFTIDQPCTIISSRKDQKILQRSPINDNDDENKKINQSTQFKQTYHVQTKTGKKGFLGLSPTGTNAKVHIRIHDQYGQISQPIELDKSTNHKNKFERGQTDEFDVGSIESLNGIDKLEVWHNDTGIGHGWFVDYIAITDNKTGEEACFFIGKYLNNENSGVEEKHLILDKQTLDNRPCREHQFDVQESTIEQSMTRGYISSPFTQTYRVETKTGHTGLFGLGGAGTNAPVFIRIHDNNDKISESIRLKNSLRHKNKFERNQTDQFDIGTRQNLDGIKKLELWHEGDKNDGWQVDYIQIIHNQTGNSYCFLVNAMLDKNSGLKDTHILLENPSINVLCSDKFKTMKTTHNITSISTTNSKKSDEIQRHFTIRTKTGNHVEAGSTKPIHIQLFDNKEQKSEDIRLKHKDHDKHNFEPGAIDVFDIISFQPLSDQLIGIGIKHNADKYQGWYAEWIQVIDEDNKKTYCYPIQRWIDKAENDQQTALYFNNTSNIPCDSLSDTVPETTVHQSISTVRKAPINTTSSQTSTQTSKIPFKNTYHIKTKTGKKGFLGLSPTGANAKVFMRIIDKDGNISENLQLHRSIDHKNKFERGQIDEFDIGTNKQLNSIDQIELWTDDKGLGSGWFPEYIEITDNQTGYITCFPIHQYLNEKNGEIEGNPLKLKRLIDNQPCQQLIKETHDNDNQSIEQNTLSNINKTPSLYKNTFLVTTKTGHTGFLGLGTAGTNAPVFIRIHDTKGKISEAIQLKNSIRHTNKFERNQTDQFDIGTRESLVGISRIELWHEGGKNDGWQVEYIQIYDNQTDTSYCFPIYSMLDMNSGLKQTHILLEKPLINISCPDQIESLKQDQINSDINSSKKKKEKYERNFTIRTKTGDQIEASPTTPIHIQLFDNQEQNSEDIRLKHQDHNKLNFEPGAIDEFQVTSNQPLSNQLIGIRIKHKADKYQGWYCDWIEITDDDHGQIYCFPIQRWIDKGENDKKTDMYFTDISNVLCDSSINRKIKSDRSTILNNRKTREIESQKSQLSSKISSIPFQNTYHVETKTGKKGFLGLSPTGTNADVYIRIIDHDGNKSESIQLKSSIDHKNKFERDKIDEFDIGSIKSLNGIKQLEIWTDGKGFGHGWYADYISIKDNKTNEETCFLIDQYLNKEYGGVADNHLLLDKQIDHIPCYEKYRTKQEDDIDTIQTRQMKAIQPNTSFTKESSSSVIAYKRTYHVDTKTGQKGFLNLSPTGTNADVYLRIHDKLGHVSEPISLSRSTKHSNPFEKGKTDSFDIGTKESLESISKLELYHNGTSLNHGWNVEYINILDNTTGHNYCFSVNKWLNNTEHLILDNYVLDVLCEDINKELIQSKIDLKDEEQKRSFTVRTKTGSQIEASSTTPIYIRLFDDQEQKSEKIRLAQKNKDGHHFKSGSIDEFHITSDQPLNTLIGIEISHKAEKHQGWYGEWISIIDNDTNEIFCFPLQRWLDKGELDGKTKIYLQRLSTSIPCEQLSDTMQRQNLILTTTSNQKSKIKDIIEDYKSKYHIQVKTAKKGLLGLSPTGTDANVFIQIHDNDGNISEPIQLKNSFDHKNKFTRGKIDDFDVGSIQELNGVDKLELWTDGKGLGSGWYPEYIQITDEKTGEINCFIIEQYLNEKYGGVKNEHLIFNKQNDTKLCQESKQEEIINQIKQNTFLNQSQLQERFQVEVKTGHTGFLGLAGAGTDVPVFIQIYDSDDKKSEIIQLKNSTRHKNKFERNQTDHFIVDTKEPLNDVAKIDLWHEGTKNDGWQVDYINVFDNKTNTSYCFPINSMLDKNSGIKQTIIHLKNPSINAFCKEQTEALMKKIHSYTSVSKKLKSDKLNDNYTIQIKTGNHPSAGSTTPIYIQLIDINNKKSKHIRLEKKDFEGHHFAPGNIDEFKINLSESLSTIKCIKISLDADKGQGWYGEWISILNDNNGQIYCFPIQRWLDKGENDHKTHIKLSQQSNIPCQQILDSIEILSNEKFLNQKNEFEIRTKTADKSLRGKSNNPVHVYLNIYNKNNQQIGNSIQLENSQTYSIPFEKHHIDQFYLSIPNLNLSDINRIDLYHDGENDGWFCDFVQFKNIQTNEIKCFSAHQWLDELSDKLHFSMTNYQNIPCQE